MRYFLILLLFPFLALAQNPANFASGIRLSGATDRTSDTRIVVMDASNNILGYIDKSDLELSLGNPTSDGQILSSTIAGIRSWINAPSTSNFMDLTTNQTAAGNKTFSGITTFNSATVFSSGQNVTMQNGLTANSQINLRATGTNPNQMPSVIDWLDTNIDQDIYGNVASGNQKFWMYQNRLNWRNSNQTTQGARIGQTNTALRTYTLPDKSGTFAMLDDITGGGGSLTIQDEGSSLTTAATTLNFTGDGVTASGTGATKTINVPREDNILGTFTLPGLTGPLNTADGDATNAIVVTNTTVGTYATSVPASSSFAHPVGTILRFANVTPGSLMQINDNSANFENKILKYRQVLTVWQRAIDVWEILDLSVLEVLTRDISLGSNSTSGFSENVVLQTAGAGSYSITVSNDANWDHEIGTILTFNVDEDATLTLTPDTSVTGFSEFSIGEGETVLMRKTASNTWQILGHYSATGNIQTDLSFRTITANETLTANDFDTDEKMYLVFNSASNIIITVDDVALIGKSVSMFNQGAGLVRFIEGTANIDANGGDAFQLAQYAHAGLIEFPGNIYRPVGSWTAFTPPSYTTQNAANPFQEANATTGFVADANVSFASSTTQVTNGTYSVYCNITNVGSTFDVDLQTTGIANGDNVTITYDLYRDGATASGNVFARLQTGSGWSVAQQFNIGDGNNNAFTSVSLTGVATQANPNVQVANGTVTSLNGVYIDNIVITIN